MSEITGTSIETKNFLLFELFPSFIGMFKVPLVKSKAYIGFVLGWENYLQVLHLYYNSSILLKY